MMYVECTAVSNNCADADSTSEPQTKSFYGSSTPQPSRPPTNNVRVYNGGAPVGFVDTPSNIHPIASLTPYQNRFFFSSYRLHCMPSHLIASSPARCRVVRPPGNLDRGPSFTIWHTVRFAAPQLQDGSSILRQRARFAAHCPWPVLKWFKFAHRCRGKLKPGGRAVGFVVLNTWLVMFLFIVLCR